MSLTMSIFVSVQRFFGGVFEFEYYNGARAPMNGTIINQNIPKIEIKTQF